MPVQCHQNDDEDEKEDGHGSAIFAGVMAGSDWPGQTKSHQKFGTRQAEPAPIVDEAMPAKPGFSTQVVDFPRIVGGKIKHQDTKTPSGSGIRKIGIKNKIMIRRRTAGRQGEAIIGLARAALVVKVGEPCFGQVHRSRWPFCFGSSNNEIRT